MRENKKKSKELKFKHVVILSIGIGFFLWFMVGHLRISITPSDGYRVFWIKNECNYEKGEFVMFKVAPDDPYVPDPERFYLIKRIVCMPGEKIERKGLAFYCNGFEIGKAVTKTRDGKPLKPWEPKVEVIPEDMFFVAGSHPRSYDSKYFGLVHKKQIEKCLTPLF